MCWTEQGPNLEPNNLSGATIFYYGLLRYKQCNAVEYALLR